MWSWISPSMYPKGDSPDFFFSTNIAWNRTKICCHDIQFLMKNPQYTYLQKVRIYNFEADLTSKLKLANENRPKG